MQISFVIFLKEGEDLFTCEINCHNFRYCSKPKNVAGADSNLVNVSLVFWLNEQYMCVIGFNGLSELPRIVWKFVFQ